MPRTIEYEIVVQQLAADGLKSRYPNGGVFGFDDPSEFAGWIGPADATIKPDARSHCRSVPAPHAENLAILASKAWQQFLPGEAWIMPGSHWSYELNYGSRDWLSQLLTETGIAPANLLPLTQAAALAFSPTEEPQFHHFMLSLLQNLQASDFSLAFPGRQTVCTVHHHKQLWWMTQNPRLIDQFVGMLNLVNPTGHA